VAFAPGQTHEKQRFFQFTGANELKYNALLASLPLLLRAANVVCEEQSDEVIQGAFLKVAKLHPGLLPASQSSRSQ